MLEIIYKNKIHEKIYNRIVHPINKHIKIKTHHNRKYFNREIFELTIYSALQNQYIESSVNQLSMHLDNISSADAIFYRFEKLNWIDILYSMQTINDGLYSEWNNKPTKNAYLAVDPLISQDIFAR